MAQVLLFNIGADKRRRIRFLLLKLGLGCREIPPEEHARVLGQLAGKDGFAAEAPDPAETPFTGEMLVMDGLDSKQFHGLLDGLRRERCPVALKAVVTGQNCRWTAARLFRELSAEHEAMKKASAKSVHQA